MKSKQTRKTIAKAASFDAQAILVVGVSVLVLVVLVIEAVRLSL